MRTIRYLFLTICACLSFNSFAQYQPDAVMTEWEIISQGKLQKNPRFKDPMITVRFIYENGAQFMNLSLKYMFTDAVFDEAIPVEYFKDEKLDVETENGKHELRAAKYAKARRMNTVAQKIADMRVVFGGDLSFLTNKLVKKFVVHYAQGYQNIDLNPQEAVLLKKAYTNFSTIVPKSVPEPISPAHRQIRENDEKSDKEKEDIQQTIPQKKESIDELRQRAKKWNK